MSLESNSLACPRLHLLGILSSDLVHRNVPQSQLIPFSVEDWKKCAQLCKRIVADAGRSAGDGGGGGGGVSTGRSFDKQLRSVLGKMMHCGYKAEIQCFETEDLCSSYLKEKLDHLPSLF